MRRLMTCFAVSMLAAGHAGAMVRCQDANGRIEYSDKPFCTAGQKPLDSVVRENPPAAPGVGPSASTVQPKSSTDSAPKPARKSRYRQARDADARLIATHESEALKRCRQLRRYKNLMQQRLASGHADASLSELRAADARLSRANCPPF
ncbi:DUF4124 domain-containing protein [Crenobacter cavernae]|uniref:DUF4124 domain-containing protein n=1 Tax=Crenobacter cavernae TaxID=2290923 RepID=A0ABY0FEF9_9NEIS|nr:DUF4124 domain-containing protein [Crenobacter cavernae]RXZ42744.1 DUF4124 domain-containing protein [Crenobacter cavernae]